MFGRRRKGTEPPSPGPELRAMALSLEPEDLGLSASDGRRVWGVAMDTRLDDGGWHCLIALGEGTTSLYTSGAFGIVGAGEHEAVHDAAGRLLDLVDAQLDLFPAPSDSTLPQAGYVTIRALTFAGPRCVNAAEADLGNGRHPASAVFYAAHEVITQMRLIYEAQT